MWFFIAVIYHGFQRHFVKHDVVRVQVCNDYCTRNPKLIHMQLNNVEKLFYVGDKTVIT
jgi:hypothetical protein